MGQLSVAEAADRLRISPQRVRQRIHAGLLPAVRIGSQWVVDESDLDQSVRTSRPMSSRMAWAFAELLDGCVLERVAARELLRLCRRADCLAAAHAANPAAISSWLADRAPIRRYSVATPDLVDLRHDHRLVLSGVSDKRSELSAAGEVEAYVGSPQLTELERDYLLVAKPDYASAKSNVVLRAVSPGINAEVVPRLMVVADLIDRRDARAAEAANRLFQGIVADRLWQS